MANRGWRAFVMECLLDPVDKERDEVVGQAQVGRMRPGVGEPGESEIPGECEW
jgi:hypothetical protein